MSGKSKSDDDSAVWAKTWRQSLFVLIFLPAMLVLCNVAFDAQSRSSRYLVDLSKTLPNIPDDMIGAAKIRASLSRITKGEQPVSILDEELDDVVCQVFESSPYVSRVTKLERQFPGKLQVGLEFKQPTTAVEAQGRYHLVDQFGDLLPLQIEPDELVSPYLTIHPGSDLMAEVGDYTEDWFLAAVKEGVFVLQDLNEHGDHPALKNITIVAIDVSNFGGRLDAKKAEVSLVTDRHWFDKKTSKERPTMLVWGRSTKHTLGLIELPVSQKLDHLREVMGSRPSGIEGLSQVDLRFDKVYYLMK